MPKLFRISAIREADPALADRIEAVLARREAKLYRPIDDVSLLEAAKHVAYLQGKTNGQSKGDVSASRGAFGIFAQKWIAESPRAAKAALNYITNLQREVTNIQRQQPARKTPAKAGRKKKK